MKFHLSTAFFLAASVVAASTSDSGCSSDNCARAVTGTQHGITHPAIAKADCSKFFQKTITPIVTVHVSKTVAPTTFTPVKRQIPTPSIPYYARVCTKPGSYASACACLGVVPYTSTAATSTTTTSNVTATVTSITSRSTSFSNTTSSAIPTCTNTISDAKNCGTCGNVCHSGVCENGSCSTSSCVAKTCGSFQNCNSNDNCFCFSSSRPLPDNGFCGVNALCDASLPCTTDTDCISGSICAVKTCCSKPSDPQPGICLQALCGNPAAKLKMMARAGRGGTAAY